MIAEGLILLLVLAAGAYYDVREHRIPNWWILVSMAAGISLYMIRTGAGDCNDGYLLTGFWFLARMLLAASAGFFLFMCRMIGAGDVKLAALMCGYLGLSGGGLSIFFGLVIGAVWSFFKMKAEKSLGERLYRLSAYIRRMLLTKEIRAYYCPEKEGYGGTIPLGVCLLAGTVVFLILKSTGSVC